MRLGLVAAAILTLAGCSEPGGTARAEDTSAGIPFPPRKPDPALGNTGPLCGDPRLQGSTSFTIKRPINACGVSGGVKLNSVSGIALTTPAVLTCETARTFADWLTGTADPLAQKTLGGSIEKVWMMGSYSCRTRNHQPGARLSEHSFGRAIDIGGVWLSTGKQITVKQNWGKGADGQYLRRIWKAACGPFKTVLGPEGDRFHKDHLHFDLAQRRSTYCR